MKILVVGGSYFYGRVFLMLASKEHEITVVNRGTYPLTEFGVKEIHGDRHDGAVWKRCGDNYDAIVDFCAYGPGDIRELLDNLAGSAARYLFVSTVDVYKRGVEPSVKSEDAPLEDRSLPGEAGAYIAGKTALERELVRECGKRGMAHTILRPAILYGPYNYAPRESEFIRLMVQQGVLPVIAGEGGRFQFVYVKDAAEAVMRCLSNRRSCGQVYNICQDETADYETFAGALRRAADVEYRELPVTARQALAGGLPVPFPVTPQETVLCSNEKGKRELGLVYTPFSEGMEKTYRAFKNVFGAG